MKSLIVPEGYGSDKHVPSVAILLTETLDPPYRAGSRYWHLQARVVEVAEDGSPRNLMQDSQPLGPFIVSCQMDEDTASGRPYAIGVVVSVDHLFTTMLDEREVQSLARTFRTINARLQKIEDTFGRTDDLAAFVLRFAEAVGVNRFIVQTASGRDGNYASGTYQFYRPAEAALHIGWAVEAAQKALKPGEVTA